ncbi:MAG: hypothetical protein AAB492_01215 [Patescibacteria group bacterium]
MKKIFFILTKRFRRWDRRMSFSKRQQFVGITVILTFLMMLTQLVPADFRYPMVIFMAIVTYGLTAFALRDDLKGAEWISLLTLPTLFTAAVALFYFLLPSRWLTRLPIVALYAVGLYALLLTENIYNVAAARTIALLRAAHSVGFLLTLTTFFLLVQTLYAFRFHPIINAFGLVLMAYPLTLQILWAMELTPKIGDRVKQLTIVTTIVLMEMSWLFSLWPTRSTLRALFLTTCFYGLTGMAQQYLGDRLYKRTVWEFFSVVFIVFCIVLLGTNWYTIP